MQDTVSDSVQKALNELGHRGVLGAVLAVDRPNHSRMVFTSGFADGDKKVPITAAHAFQIGSQTKVFTAVAILMLAQQGQLDLSDPVAKYIPGMPGDEEATIRHLLHHTSGFADGISVLDEATDLPDIELSFEDLALLSRIDGQHGKAGDRFQYNNFAYDVLGVIIEKVSGQPYDTYIRAHILRPLGLDHTFSASRLPWPRALLADGYIYSEKQQQKVKATGPRDLSWASSAGDMISTVGDMLTWWHALIDGGNPLGVSLPDMASDIVAVPGGGEMTGYGYGLMQRRFSGITAWGHGGSIHGYISYSGYDPESGTQFSLMTSLAGDKDMAKQPIMAEISNVIRVVLHVFRLTADNPRP